MYDIYYAHHQWKYGTKEEAYEIDLIKRYFPNANIFNPSTDLSPVTDTGDEALIMKECLEKVRNSDILLFSSLDGCVGTGVYHEVLEATNSNKLVLYIYQDSIFANFEMIERTDGGKTDRFFAMVNVKEV